MSDGNVPPAGEEIHLPGPSVQPLVLTLGLTVALIGITFEWLLTVGGGLLVLWVILRWIADTRRDINALPLEHRH